MRVALVVMPFAAATRPSLAVGLLKACLEQEGLRADAKYFNLTFESLLGRKTYHRLSQSNLTCLAGEWIFSQLLYGTEVSDWDSFYREVLDHPIWGMAPKDRPLVQAALQVAPRFLSLVYESNDWSRYDLVGFTSTFQQTLPSLCLARRIRERHPEVKIALGGANFEAGMGRPYIENFDFVDFVATGEADTALPALCQALREVKVNPASQLEVPPGFLYRHNGHVVDAPVSSGTFVDLDRLPTPDFDEYFQGAGRDPDWISVEASRGCWWGQKSHCTFCGLNGAGMSFRRKGWRRVVAEIDDLTSRYGAHPLQFADNILSMEYFRDLLPFWGERGDGIPKFFEIKANLRRRHVEALRDAGIVHVQAGIESLSDSTLRLMGKGVTAAQNIALIRWCTELGVFPHWNVIYGFPGEDPEDYERNVELLRKLTHMPPPEGMGPIRLDRFSPNFDRWREQGFTGVSLLAAYRHLYPFSEETLWELAYFFDYDHPRRSAAMEAGEEILRLGQIWGEKAEAGESGELVMLPHWQGGFVVKDSRFLFEPRTERLTDQEIALLLACDAPTSKRRAIQKVAGSLGGTTLELDEALRKLRARSLVAEAEGRTVTLCLLPTSDRLAEQSTLWRQHQARVLERAP